MQQVNKNLLLIINTGNTSTKLGIYKNHQPVFVDSIKHPDAELAAYPDINAQKDFREGVIIEFLKQQGIDLGSIFAISARGGLLRPLKSGTYLVNKNMIHDLQKGERGLHASHLSAQIGQDLAERLGINCYIVDPISVDEFEPIARFTGHRSFERTSLSHALNMKAVSKRFAKEQKQPYSQLTLIVIHLGTGISLSIHKDGKMVDLINSSEEGAFSLDRSGSLPILQVARYIIDRKLDFKQFSREVFGEGGVFSYLKTKDFLKIRERCKNGDEQAINITQAMIYQIAKEAGAMATVVNGKVDAILITGGIAHDGLFINGLKDKIGFLAPITVYPGENEIEALAEGVYRVVEGEEEVNIY